MKGNLAHSVDLLCSTPRSVEAGLITRSCLDPIGVHGQHLKLSSSLLSLQSPASLFFLSLSSHVDSLPATSTPNSVRSDPAANAEVIHDLYVQGCLNEPTEQHRHVLQLLLWEILQGPPPSNRKSYDSLWSFSHPEKSSRYHISHFLNIKCAKRTFRMENEQETQSSTTTSEAELAILRSEIADKIVADYEAPFDKLGGLNPLQALSLSIGDGPQSHRGISDMQDLHIDLLIRNYKTHRELEKMLKGDFDLRQERDNELVTRLREEQAGCEKRIRVSQSSLEHLLCFSYLRLKGIEELLWGVGHKFPVDSMGRAITDGGPSEQSDPHYPRLTFGSPVPSVGASNESGNHSRNGSANSEVEQSPCVAKVDKPVVPSNTSDNDAEMGDIEATVARLGLTLDGPDIDDKDEDSDVGLTEGQVAKEKLEL